MLESVKFISVAIVGLCLYEFRDERYSRPFLCVLIAAGVFYSVYGLAQAHGHFPHDYWANPGQVSSRLVNSTHFAGFLLMPLMAALGLLFSRSRWIWKVFPLIALPVLSYGLLSTLSRSGWLCFLVSLLVYVFLMVRRYLGSFMRLRKVIVSGMLAGILLGSAFLFHNSFRERITILKATKFQTLTQRVQVWSASGEVLCNYPMGIGAGNLFLVSSRYKLFSDRFLIDFAHDELLQVAIEYGILGLSIVLFLLVLYQKRMSAFLRQLAGSGVLSLHAALYASVVGLLVQSLVDFPLRIPSNAFILFAIIGFQLGLADARAGASSLVPTPLQYRWRGQAAAALCLLGALIFTAQAYRLHRSEAVLSEARSAAGRFSWTEAKDLFERGLRLAPSDARFEMGLGELAMQRSILTKDKEPLLMEASAQLERAFAKAPLNERVRSDLAKTYASLGREEGAESLYKMGVFENPQVRKPYLDLGWFLLSHDVYHEAGFFLKRSIPMACCEASDATLQATLEKFYSKTKDYGVLKGAVPQQPDFMNQFAQFLSGKADKEGFARAEGDALALTQSMANVGR